MVRVLGILGKSIGYCRPMGGRVFVRSTIVGKSGDTILTDDAAPEFLTICSLDTLPVYEGEIMIELEVC